MNKARRKAIEDLRSRLLSLQTEIEILRDEEDEAFDALSEGLQSSPRGEAMQTAVGDLEEAGELIEQVRDALERAAA